MKFREWLVAAAVAFGVLLCGAAWSLSSPVGSSPDDSYHMPSIWCVDATATSKRCQELPDGAEGERQVRVPGLVATAQCYAFNALESARCQDAVRGTRISTASVDDGDYPGGFYRVMNLFVGDSVVKSVLMMRIFNVGLAALVFVGVALASGPSVRRIMGYTLPVALIPLGWFIIASVNPSSWAIIGVTGFGFGLHSFLQTSRRPQTIALAALTGLCAGLAVSARGDAAVYIGIVAVSVVTLHWRTVWARKWLALLPAAACVLAGVVALSAGQVGGTAGIEAQTDRPASEVLVSLLQDWPGLISGMFGYSFGLGWLDTAVPSLTAFPVVLVLGFLFLSGLGQGRAAKTLACLGIGLPLLLLPLMTLYRARMVVGENVQPRYLLPLLPILIGLLLTGREPASSVKLTRVQGAVISGALAASCAAALYANVRRYVTGIDGAYLIRVHEWWWPWAPSPFLIVAIGALGFLVLSAPLWLLSRPGGDQYAGLVFERDLEVGEPAAKKDTTTTPKESTNPGSDSTDVAGEPESSFR